MRNNRECIVCGSSKASPLHELCSPLTTPFVFVYTRLLLFLSIRLFHFRLLSCILFFLTPSLFLFLHFLLLSLSLTPLFVLFFLFSCSCFSFSLRLAKKSKREEREREREGRLCFKDGWISFVSRQKREEGKRRRKKNRIVEV